jgi:hypothetical protein
MAWVAWLGRGGRREPTREEVTRRMAKAMDKEHPILRVRRAVVEPERSTGVALRRSASRPARDLGDERVDIRGRRAS